LTKLAVFPFTDDRTVCTQNLIRREMGAEKQNTYSQKIE